MKPEDKIFLARIFVAVYQSKTTYDYCCPSWHTFELKLLGILAIIIALPLIILLASIALIVPQKQWEQFWDDFLEL